MLKNFAAGIGILFCLFAIAKTDPAPPDVNGLMNRAIQCMIKDDVHDYLQMNPVILQMLKGSGNAKNKADHDMLSKIKFNTTKELVKEFLGNQYDIYKAGVSWQKLRAEKNKILGPKVEAFHGQKISIYKVFCLLTDTTTGQSYIMESQLEFLEDNIFGSITVQEFEPATSIEAYLGQLEEQSKIKPTYGIGSVTVVNMDEDEPNTEYFDKTFEGIIGKDSATFTFNYRNEWGSNFIGSAVYQLQNSEPVNIFTDYIDTVSSFYDEEREILWLVMEAGDILRGVQLSQKGEILNKINMRLKE